jgi:excisionase family DNA binding protein
MANPRAVLKPADVAPLLGVTTGRVYQLITAGAIPAVRTGRSLLIPCAAWEAWLAEQSDRALAAARRARRKRRSAGARN